MGSKLLVTWLDRKINIMKKITEISSNGAKPLENSNIPADTNDGNDLKKLDFSSRYTDPDDLGVRSYTGTEGVNVFQAEALINATPEIIAKHTGDDGRINWRKIVKGTHKSHHGYDHWIEGPGEIVINDFEKDDRLVFRGHSARTILLEESENVAVVGLISDQGRDARRGTGAHDFDVLGKVTIHHDGSFDFDPNVLDASNNVFDGVSEFA